jgi:iron complex outermembrane receptor protein
MVRSLLFSLTSGLALAATYPTTSNAQGTATLEEITVTAQRRNETLQSVPISVSAITAETARKMGVVTTDDLNVTTPGLNLTHQTAALVPVLRAIGSTNSSAGDEPSTALYVDGVYWPSMPGSVIALSNIERVEVLKGPQGTLFGRNAMGGVIHIITKDPTATPALRASLGYGSYGTAAASFYGSTRLAENLAANLSASYMNQDRGFGTNLFTENDLYKERELSLRTKWLFNLTVNTELKITADYNDLNSSLGVPRRAAPGAVLLDGVTKYSGFRINNENLDPYAKVEQWGGSSHITHDFSKTRFVSITAYRVTDSTEIHDQDGTPSPLLDLTIPISTKMLTQEFQLLSAESSSFHWVLGAFYLDGSSEYHPLRITGRAIRLPFIEKFARQDTESWAGFGQATFPLFSGVNLTLGARYTFDKRHLRGKDVSSVGILAKADKERTFSNPTWRTALDRKFTEQIMGYVSYVRGFKSGVFNTTNIAADPVNPETLDAYEFGIKSDLMDRRLRLNAAAFFYDTTDLQLNRVVPGGSALFNAARGKVKGFELELAAVPSDALTVRGGLSLLDAKYTSFPDAPFTTPRPTGGNSIAAGDASGNMMARTPKWTLNLGADLARSTAVGKIGLTVNYYYNSGFFWEVDNRVREGSYHLVNAQTSWIFTDERWLLRLWGKNLLDEQYQIHLNTGNGDQATPAEPLTYGLSVDYHF